MSLNSLFKRVGPSNLFDPNMPAVDPRNDLPVVVAKVRAQLVNSVAENRVALLTPGRLAMMIPAPKPGTVPEAQAASTRSLFPGAGLKITVVSYTKLDAIQKNPASAVPMLGILLGLAYVGQNVLVFEGHPSAFEDVVSGSDVLLIDSGMLPFLHPDWFAMADRVMRAGRKILLCDRKNLQVTPLAKSNNPPGWQPTEPDGEASYTNCLLTTLAKLPPQEIMLVAGHPPPDLRKLAVTEDEREWAQGLPFNYDTLDCAKVIALVCKFAGPMPVASQSAETTLRAKLATGKGVEDVSFQLKLTAPEGGNTCLEILRLAPK